MGTQGSSPTPGTPFRLPLSNHFPTEGRRQHSQSYCAHHYIIYHVTSFFFPRAPVDRRARLASARFARTAHKDLIYATPRRTQRRNHALVRGCVLREHRRCVREALRQGRPNRTWAPTWQRSRGTGDATPDSCARPEGNSPTALTTHWPAQRGSGPCRTGGAAPGPPATAPGGAWRMALVGLRDQPRSLDPPARPEGDGPTE